MTTAVPSRRRFLKASALGLAAGWARPPWARPADSSGTTAAESFDEAMHLFMKERGVPGGALAVTRGDRLDCARGYGWADRDHQVEARPDSLFRIASLSKPLTAVVVLRLAEQGQMDLDSHPYDTLGWAHEAPPEGATVDPRLKQVTVRQLLQHTGGWD